MLESGDKEVTDQDNIKEIKELQNEPKGYLSKSKPYFLSLSSFVELININQVIYTSVWLSKVVYMVILLSVSSATAH